KTTFSFVPAPGSAASQLRHFTRFPNSKKNLLPEQYLRKASAGQPIRSSIPDAMEQSRTDARNAAKSATQMRDSVRNIGLLALVGLALALVSLYLQVANLIQSSVTLSRSVDQQLSSLAAESKTTADRLQKWETQVERISQQAEQLGRDLALLSQRVQSTNVDQIEKLNQQMEQ